MKFQKGDKVRYCFGKDDEYYTITRIFPDSVFCYLIYKGGKHHHKVQVAERDLELWVNPPTLVSTWKGHWLKQLRVKRKIEEVKKKFKK